jgi:hypothetical protein
MKTVRTKVVLALAAAGLVSAIAGTASAQSVCVNLHVQVNNTTVARAVCLPPA